MKVKLKVNLKVGHGQIEGAGTIYSDENGELPEFVALNMGEDFSDTRFFDIIENTVSENKAPKAVKAEKTKPESTDTPKTDTPKVKRMLKKQA